MNKKDMILVAVLLAAAFAFVIPQRISAGKGDAYIYVGSELYGVYDLSKPATVHIENGNGIVNDIEISQGSVFMKDATCPGKQCMNSGHISRNNESICCAPAGILIIIRSGTDDEYDAITD